MYIFIKMSQFERYAPAFLFATGAISIACGAHQYYNIDTNKDNNKYSFLKASAAGFIGFFLMFSAAEQFDR